MSDDDQLVRKVRGGDQNALAELIERSRGQLLATAARKMSDILKRSVEPDDVVQEAVTYCLKTFSELDCSTLDPMPWIHQVLERRIIDAHRHFAAQKRAADKGVQIGGGPTDSSPGLIDLLVASITSASQAFSRNRREEKLMQAMQQLTQEQQDALRMRYVENLPSKDIAERLNKSDGAIRVMLTRSLRQLEELLDEGTME